MKVRRNDIKIRFLSWITHIRFELYVNFKIRIGEISPSIKSWSLVLGKIPKDSVTLPVAIYTPREVVLRQADRVCFVFGGGVIFYKQLLGSVQVKTEILPQQGNYFYQ